MAKCDLAIDIDRDPQSLRPGDSFSGHVTAAADTDVRCDDLLLELRWVTDGKGSEDSKVIESWQLFAGQLRTGERQSFPFTARIPDSGPSTYRGKILKIDWELRARADIPWAIDAKAALPLVVGNRAAPPGEDGYEHQANDDGLDDETDEDGERAVEPGLARTARSRRQRAMLVGAIVLSLALAAGLALGLWRPVWGLLALLPRLVRGDLQWSDTPDLAIGSFVLGLYALLLWVLARESVIARRLGDVECVIEPEILRPGEEVRCVVRFTPRTSLQLDGISARLRSVEECERGSGKSRRTWKHVAFEQRVELSPARAVSPGLPYEVRGAVRVPGDAAPSFWADDNELDWKVDVAIRIPRFPDWRHETTLTVVP